MTLLSAALMALLFILAVAPASSAEYIIYLKGGHYIVADTCTFLARQEVAKEPDAENKSVFVEDCTKGKPEGPILWSTIDGKFGEVDADNVYAIYGTKGLGKKGAPRWTSPLEEYPLQDYVITNRGESFVNAKTYKENAATVYGSKRDELATVDRRAVKRKGIAPEGAGEARLGEGLCPGERTEFSVTETDVVERNLVGVITNLSKEPWIPSTIEVEVRELGILKGKFKVIDINVLKTNENTVFDWEVRPHLLKYVEKFKDPKAGVRLCYRKVKTGQQPPPEERPPIRPPTK